MTTKTVSKPARLGVWTPWAEVLCIPCNNKGTGSGMKKLKDGPAPADYRRGGRCDGCGVRLMLNEEIAFLSWLRGPVHGARLEQTGGMCCALVIDVSETEHIVITTMDGPTSIGHYKNNTWTTGDYDEDEITAYEGPDSLDGWHAAARFVVKTVAEIHR